MSTQPRPSDFPRLSTELEHAAHELIGTYERYAGQTELAIDAGLSAETVESVRQGCYSDAELASIIRACGRKP